MRYDLHVHSAPLSPCASSSAARMCERARQAGLTGIGFTEHDVWWPSGQMKALRRQYPDLVILEGIEMTCRDDHFLVYLPEHTRRPNLETGKIGELMRIVHEVGGIVIWAHPFRYRATCSNELSEAELDGIEVSSTNMSEQASTLALAHAKAHQGLCTLRNSDAHHSARLGKHWNLFETSITSVNDLIRAVRQWGG